ncbi:MAG TPA: PLP-dependent transferase, partial [Oscillospiraceae bacterium]|nr:PLP-dependent transferase [Oscillospiraceae bacterium]
VKDKNLAEKLYFIQNATGGVLPPFDSFLLIRGIKTLSVRMDRHISNAEAAAKYLKTNPAVKEVYYPGLKDNPGYEIQKKQADGAGGMISFELADGYSSAKFFDGLKLIALAESLGGVESLACHPSTMTHASIPQEIREKVGITENLIRISIGIESEKDIIDDLENALRFSREG